MDEMERMGTTTTLYRAYDQEGSLLYVGVTADFPTRRRAHIMSKPWARLVARWTTQTYPTRHEALVAEQRAIYAESPQFNKMRPHSPPLSPAQREQVAGEQSRAWAVRSAELSARASQDVEQARRALARARTEYAIRQAIESAPPLDDDTLAKLRTLITPLAVDRG